MPETRGPSSDVDAGPRSHLLALARCGEVPVAQLLSRAAFRPGERYALVVIDGALAVGALISLGARPPG